MLFHLRVKFLDKQHAPGGRRGRRLPFDSFDWLRGEAEGRRGRGEGVDKEQISYLPWLDEREINNF